MPTYTGLPTADSIKGSLVADLINSLGGDDTVKSGNGNDTIYAGDGNDYVDAGNDQDKIYAGTGNDTIYAGSGHDTIYGGDGGDSIDAGSGNDSIYGDGTGMDTLGSGGGNDFIDTKSGDDWVKAGSGNDTIIGDSGNDTIYGDGDTGSYAAASEMDKITIKYEGGESVAFHNTLGYYVMDGLGNPVSGGIIFRDQVDVPAGTEFTIDVPDASQIGYFVIPNGGVQNTISNGDPVTFAINGGGKWAVYKGATELVGSSVEGVLGGATAYFSNQLLNADGVDHEVDNASIGNHNWEDLFGGGDLDFNDVNLTITVKEGGPGGFTAGDVIELDSGNDVVVYHKGFDGVDEIKDFLYNGVDTLKLQGAVLGTTNFDQVGSDVIVSFDDAAGAIKLDNITVDLVVAHTQFI